MNINKIIENKYLFPLIFCLFFALLVRICIAVFLPGAWRSDEIFQYMEPAHELLDGHGVVTWEWRTGIRSWLLPTFIAILMKIGIALGFDNLILFIRLCFSTISLSLVAVFFWYGWRKGGLFLALILGLAAALWPDIASGGMRTLGEFVAGNLLCLAVVFIIAYRDEYNPRVSSILASCAGFLLGATAAVRFQIAPASVLAFLFIFKKGHKKQIFLASIFSVIPILFLGIFDYITLGSIFQSITKNYHYNQTLGVADSFGKKSITYYIKKYTELWGGFLPLVILFALQSGKEKVFLISISSFIVFYHSLISHKEVSFVYPAVPILILCAALGFYNVLNNNNQKKYRYILIFSVSMTCVFLGSYAPILSKKGNGINFERWASKQNDVCGIASWGYDSSSVFSNLGGGYSILKNIVPIYLFDNMNELHYNEEKFNYLITDDMQVIFERKNKWTLIKCVDNSMCIYHRPGKCLGFPEFDEISNKLMTIGK
ncbi:Alg9-like mannosyltransferase [Acetobacter estunensis NRIC 0472]|nr:hypothetical protein [Acetobacter estunensis]GBQ25820.1 Alg9-like mannosyltransferase [Acetobacter estunensis NRIC 0472]